MLLDYQWKLLDHHNDQSDEKEKRWIEFGRWNLSIKTTNPFTWRRRTNDWIFDMFLCKSRLFSLSIKFLRIITETDRFHSACKEKNRYPGSSQDCWINHWSEWWFVDLKTPHETLTNQKKEATKINFVVSFLWSQRDGVDWDVEKRNHWLEWSCDEQRKKNEERHARSCS